MVVKELWAAIEKCGLVLVTLDDEFFSAAQSVASVVEIRNHAANEKIRAPTGDMKNPGEHGGSGRLAMGPGDDDRGVAADEIVLEKLRHGTVRNFLIED